MTNDLTEDVQIQALRFYDKIRNLDTNQYDILKGVALGYCLGRFRAVPIVLGVSAGVMADSCFKIPNIRESVNDLLKKTE